MTLYAPTEVSVFVTPGDAAPAKELPPWADTPLMVIVKALAAAVPPLSFTTFLMTVSVGGLSLFVIVQVALPPAGRFPEHPAE